MANTPSSPFGDPDLDETEATSKGELVAPKDKPKEAPKKEAPKKEVVKKAAPKKEVAKKAAPKKAAKKAKVTGNRSKRLQAVLDNYKEAYVLGGATPSTAMQQAAATISKELKNPSHGTTPTAVLDAFILLK